MKFKKISKDEFVIKLQVGDDIKKSLLDFAGKNKIKLAFFQGIGAVSESVLSFYNVKTENYEPEKLKVFGEILDLTGSITRDIQNEPLVHAHMTISTKQHKAFGGHVEMGCIIGVTGEIYLKEFNKKILRKPEFKRHLKLMDI